MTTRAQEQSGRVGACICLGLVLLFLGVGLGSMTVQSYVTWQENVFAEDNYLTTYASVVEYEVITDTCSRQECHYVGSSGSVASPPRDDKFHCVTVYYTCWHYNYILSYAPAEIAGFVNVSANTSNYVSTDALAAAYPYDYQDKILIWYNPADPYEVRLTEPDSFGYFVCLAVFVLVDLAILLCFGRGFAKVCGCISKKPAKKGKDSELGLELEPQQSRQSLRISDEPPGEICFTENPMLGLQPLETGYPTPSVLDNLPSVSL